MRSTKIVCTMGPSSSSVEMIRSLVQAGMNVARLNMSHGNQDTHRETMEMLRTVNSEVALQKKLPPCVAILLDTKGPEIRTGDRATPLIIKAGDEVVFTADPHYVSDTPVIEVNYEGFSHDVREAERILIDNGEMSLDLLDVRKDGSVLARARDGGSIGSRRHVNLPGANLGLEALSEKDWSDIEFGIREGADFVALSFVRTAEDVERVREFLSARKSTMQIIAKIETRQAVENIHDIVRVSDGIMVARGDLGAEVPFENVPVIQDDIVALCRDASKPVIVATHMLESMIHQPIPTRAEVTDIAHAATTRTDATMLSGETAGGKHVLGSVDAMDRVLRATEVHLARQQRDERVSVSNKREARAESAVSLARAAQATAILVITRSGKTARDVAKYRPELPILAFTPDASVQRQLQLSYGVIPFAIEFHSDPEQTIATAMSVCRDYGLVKNGDQITVVSDVRAGEETFHSIQMRKIA